MIVYFFLCVCVLGVLVENQFTVDAGFISGLPVVIRQCAHSDAGTMPF